MATGESTLTGSRGVVQGNPNSWKGSPIAGEAGLESETTWPRAQTTGIALNTVPRGTKRRRLIRTGHHRESGRGEGSPRGKKLGRTKTLAHSPQGF